MAGRACAPHMSFYPNPSPRISASPTLLCTTKLPKRSFLRLKETEIFRRQATVQRWLPERTSRHPKTHPRGEQPTNKKHTAAKHSKPADDNLISKQTDDDRTTRGYNRVAAIQEETSTRKRPTNGPY